MPLGLRGPGSLEFGVRRLRRFVGLELTAAAPRFVGDRRREPFGSGFASELIDEPFQPLDAVECFTGRRLLAPTPRDIADFRLRSN